MLRESVNGSRGGGGGVVGQILALSSQPRHLGGVGARPSKCRLSWLRPSQSLATETTVTNPVDEIRQ